MSYLDKYYDLSNKKYKKHDDIIIDHIARLEAVVTDMISYINILRKWLLVALIIAIIGLFTGCQPTTEYQNYYIWEQIGG